MDLIELELSLKTINILQKADVWLLEDIVDKMKEDPASITLAFFITLWIIGVAS